ncbi:hypothetical protein TRVL_04215 [Trypanosoma vivax]|nr:hypothetical protein TRVL_04215 [Trypanosoma vivax]
MDGKKLLSSTEVMRAHVCVCPLRFFFFSFPFFFLLTSHLFVSVAAAFIFAKKWAPRFHVCTFDIGTALLLFRPFCAAGKLLWLHVHLFIHFASLFVQLTLCAQGGKVLAVSTGLAREHHWWEQGGIQRQRKIMLGSDRILICIGKLLFVFLLLYVSISAVRTVCCLAFLAANPEVPGTGLLSGEYWEQVQECLARY